MNGQLLLAMLLLVAPPATRRTLVDMEGRAVVLPAPGLVRRSAILTSPAIQITYLLGVQDRLCAVTGAARRMPLLLDFDPRLREVPVVRAQAGQVNLEALLATRPDVVVGSEVDLQPVEAGTTLPALRVAAGGNGQFTRQIQEEVAFLGRIFGREARARACIAWLDATRARLARDRPRQAVRVYFGFGPDHLTTFGSGTFMQEWIEAAGCRNAAEGIRTAGGKEGGLAQISPEQLLAWAPDLLVLDEGDPAALARDSRWATLPAVRKGAVHRLPAGVFLWNRASFESACLLPLWLASRAGGGIDMKAEASRFYAEMFGFHLGEARLDNLLDPH